MAFPWQCINRVAFTGKYIAEDYKLGLDCARAGMPALFCPDACITSYFPSTTEGIASQRTRWEHGHIALIVNEMPALFVKAIATCNVRLFGFALDLSVPPLALLMLLALAVFFASMAFYAITNSALPLCLSSVSLFLLGASVLLSWLRYARHVVSFRNLAYAAAVYALWKIPLYVRYLVNRQVEWVRSRRDGE
jgi:cellulose synthase/poly-beta-1,6-N-acetylglucosamine synthase-like glycosyltransferase